MASWMEPNAQGAAPAAADLHDYQYRAVKLDPTGAVTPCTSAGEKGVGILQNKPARAGVSAGWYNGGTVKAKVGGNVAEGDNLTADTDAMLITTTTATHYVYGQALEDGVDGQVISITACVPWKLT